MESAILIHRLHFAFTATFHYLFPQLTMGLALLIVVLKSLALRTNKDIYNQAARFWARIFGINFIMGVVTGIPMEFQFGTNWSQFSRWTGGVIGQPLVMEGVFAFFLESAFLGLFLYSEKRLSPRGHWWAAFLVFLGSWLSGYFIIATDAWMQHPVAFERAPDGAFHVISFWGLLANPWALLQYAHTKRVFPVSPTTFTAYLQVIALGLRGMQVEQHAHEVLAYVAELQREFTRFSEDFDLIGTHLGRAQSKYADAEKRLDRFEGKLDQAVEEQDELEGETLRELPAADAA